MAVMATVSWLSWLSWLAVFQLAAAARATRRLRAVCPLGGGRRGSRTLAAALYSSMRSCGTRRRWGGASDVRIAPVQVDECGGVDGCVLAQGDTVILTENDSNDSKITV
jgi:hypothetical protein